jgi:hypothetical protein
LQQDAIDRRKNVQVVVEINEPGSESRQIDKSLELSAEFPIDLGWVDPAEGGSAEETAKRVKPSARIHQARNPLGGQNRAIERQTRMPAHLKCTIRRSPGIHGLLGVGRIDEENCASDSAERRQIEDSSTRLGPDPEIVGNYKQASCARHG